MIILKVIPFSEWTEAMYNLDESIRDGNLGKAIDYVNTIPDDILFYVDTLAVFGDTQYYARFYHL